MVLLRVLGCAAAVLLVSAFPARTFAQDSSAIKGLRVVVPDARGKGSSGAAALTRALRRSLAEAVGPLIPSRDLESVQKRLKQDPKLKWDAPELSTAAKEVNAQYVLTVEITRDKKYLFTAHAMLIRVDTGEVQMDFRSQYYKPSEEADDRGRRIGARVIAKLEELGKAGKLPPIAGVEGNEPAAVVAPKPEVPPRTSTATASPTIVASTSPGSSAPLPGAGVAMTVIQPREEAEQDVLRLAFAGGAGLLRTYDVSSADTDNSRLSYRLSPLAMLALDAEATVPNIPAGITLRAAYRPVRFAVKIDNETAVDAQGRPVPNNPSGTFLDTAAMFIAPIALSGEGRTAYKLIPGAGLRFALLNVRPHRGNIVVNYTSFAPIIGAGVRMPFNEVMELTVALDGGLILGYDESPGKSGTDYSGGVVIGGDIKARIWLSSAIGIAFDTRFDYESLSFEGQASRMRPSGETLEDVSSVTKDLRTSVGIAFRL